LTTQQPTVYENDKKKHLQDEPHKLLVIVLNLYNPVLYFIFLRNYVFTAFAVSVTRVTLPYRSVETPIT
jgi:hypothetical protein